MSKPPSASSGLDEPFDGRAHAGSSGADTPPPSGAGRLKASARRLGRFMRAQVPEPSPDDPQPTTEWGQRIEERILAVEQQLANQNRLLLFSFVAIIADVVAKVVTH